MRSPIRSRLIKENAWLLFKSWPFLHYCWFCFPDPSWVHHHPGTNPLSLPASHWFYPASLGVFGAFFMSVTEKIMSLLRVGLTPLPAIRFTFFRLWERLVSVWCSDRFHCLSYLASPVTWSLPPRLIRNLNFWPGNSDAHMRIMPSVHPHSFRTQKFTWMRSALFFHP